ncbi:MAG: LysR family transcriptional regulator [Planctomycetaceae bacterium]|nr:MAG: LysR family transcriptional regulator [Planctomycetaceae bacterium]
MHLRTLELFCSVAECQSFSRAASEHAVTQSAVSQSIQHLEELLGTRLLDRSRRPLTLTPAGEVYLAGVLKLLRGYQRLEQEVRAVDGRIAGRLNIGAIYSIGSTYMPSAREEFRKRHPDVEVRFEYGSSDSVAQMVESGEVDFGLVSYPKSTRRLRFVNWLEEPMRVISAAGHQFAGVGEIELSELDGQELVGFDASLRIRRVVDSFLSRHGVSVDVSMEFDNIDSMIRAVQANNGLAILPESTVRKECADGSLRIVACKRMQLTRPLGIVLRRAGGLTRAADEFTSLLLGRSIRPAVAAKRAAGDEPKSKPLPVSETTGRDSPVQPTMRASVVA